MKKNFTTMISVVVCVLLIVNLIQIQHLKQEVTDLRAEMHNEIRAVSNVVSSNVSSISGNVRSAMEEERNLLTTGQWQCGEVDFEKKTAEVICTIVPKEYTPGSTQVSILCNEREWEMAYQDSEYTAKIEVPLFERSEVIQVKLNDKGTIRTQALDWVIEPRYGAVLNVNARYDGHSVVHHNRQSHTYAPEQLVEIQLEKQGEFTIRSADVLVLLDGKEYKRFPVDLTVKGQEAYRDTASKKLECIPESPAPVYSVKDSDGIYSESYVYWMDQGWNIPEGSIVEFYVEVVDETGLRYRSFLEWFEVSGSEEAIRQMDEKSAYMGAEPVLIFDETGTIVYELVPGLFR